MNLKKFELRQDIVDWEPEKGAFGKEYKDKETSELYISCECGAEVLKIEQFADEEQIYISVFKYSVRKRNLKERISDAYKAFKGDGIDTADVILSKENFNKLRNFGKKV